MWCLMVFMVFPNCPEIDVVIHHFYTEKEANEKLKYYENYYVENLHLKDYIEDIRENFYDRMDSIRKILYANDFGVNNDPFEYKLFEVTME